MPPGKVPVGSGAGLYKLVNKEYQTAIDLAGDPNNTVSTWTNHTQSNQLWLLMLVPGSSDEWTIINYRSPTMYLGVKDGYVVASTLYSTWNIAVNRSWTTLRDSTTKKYASATGNIGDRIEMSENTHDNAQRWKCELYG